MGVQVAKVWEALRSSYWFLPAIMSLLAAALSLVIVDIDQWAAGRLPLDAWWLYGGGPSGARAILAAIIGSMVSVTSVVFSITIVALTLASGQFGPRLLRGFMRDRANQVVLGTFIATFVYALLVMRSVQGGEDRAFVPPLAVTAAIVMVIGSVGLLIFFIHHIASSIQADQVVASISREVVGAIERLFPAAGAGEAADEPAWSERATRRTVEARDDGYLQLVDLDRLMGLAGRHDLVLVIQRRPGDWVARGEVLVHVTGGDGASFPPTEDLASAFVLGPHRTLTQDAEFGFQQLVEVAVRALSPGINDPFTAMTCIDRLSALLRRLAQRSFPPRVRRDRGGSPRLVCDTSSFEGFVNTAYRQIRQNAAQSVAVLARLLEGIESVAAACRTTPQREILLRHADLVLAAAEVTGIAPHDMKDLQSRHARVRAAARSPFPPKASLSVGD